MTERLSHGVWRLGRTAEQEAAAHLHVKLAADAYRVSDVIDGEPLAQLAQHRVGEAVDAEVHLRLTEALEQASEALVERRFMRVDETVPVHVLQVLVEHELEDCDGMLDRNVELGVGEEDLVN